MTMNKKTFASIAERVARAFVVAFVGSLVVSGVGVTGAVDMSLLQKAGLAGVAAVLNLVLALLGTNVGNPTTPALLPAASDPATPTIDDGLGGRVATLEEQIPAVAALGSTITDAVIAGIVQAFKNVTAAPVAVAPQAQVEAAAQKAAEKVLRDEHGRFAPRNYSAGGQV